MSTAAQCTPQTDDEYITIVNTAKERYANNPEPAKKRAKERYCDTGSGVVKSGLLIRIGPVGSRSAPPLATR